MDPIKGELDSKFRKLADKRDLLYIFFRRTKMNSMLLPHVTISKFIYNLYLGFKLRLGATVEFYFMGSVTRETHIRK